MSQNPEGVDPKWTTWSANVADRFKGKSVEEIKAELQASAFPFAVCMENWQGDFNLSTVIRNSNGFNAAEVFYLCNRKRYDRRGAVGTYKYTEVTHLPCVEELEKLRAKYPIFIGVDNVPGSVPMEDFVWPENCLMIFGEESCGLTPEVLALCDYTVAISMFGSVRSFNAGVASGITMFDFVSKFNRKKR